MDASVLLTKLLVAMSILLETHTHFSNDEAYTLVYHQEQQDYQTASATCKSHGGSLPIIKNYIIPEILADVPSLRNVSVWIGLTLHEGAWHWDDGSYAKKQYQKSDGCMSVWLQPDTEPVPQTCETKLPFFCQYHQGNCYFRIYRHSSIVGHNTFSLARTSLTMCKDVCGHVTEFECASFEYSPVNRFCQLNDVNRWTAEENYVYFDQSWDYYHKTCYISTVLSEDSEQTSIFPMFSDTVDTTTMAILQSTEEPNLALIQPRLYLLQSMTLSWKDAEEYCIQSNGHLAKFDDPSNIPEIGYQSLENLEELLWIGLKRTQTQGWQWSDSTDLRWSNFKYQPNEYDFIRACGTVSLPSGWWFTDVCDQKMRFMCQYTTDSCEFIPTINASIIAHNSEIFTNISQEECQQYCIDAVLCRSYEYNNNIRVCQLSQDNRWSAPQFFHTYSTNWTYVHRRCNFGYDSMTESTSPMTSTDYLTTVVDETTTESKTTVEPTVVADRMFQEIKQELEHIGQEIKQKRLDQSRRSATDDRPSAQGVGIAAIIILVAICGSIVILDISTIAVQCKQFSNQGRRQSSKYKHRPVFVHNNNSNICVTTCPSNEDSPPETVDLEHIQISTDKTQQDTDNNIVEHLPSRENPPTTVDLEYNQISSDITEQETDGNIVEHPPSRESSSMTVNLKHIQISRDRTEQDTHGNIVEHPKNRDGSSMIVDLEHIQISRDRTEQDTQEQKSSEFQIEKMKRDNIVFQSSTVDGQNSTGNSEPKSQVDHIDAKSKSNSDITCELDIISADNNPVRYEESNIKLKQNNDTCVCINPEETVAKVTTNHITYL